jgi:hypothetical protein
MEEASQWKAEHEKHAAELDARAALAEAERDRIASESAERCNRDDAALKSLNEQVTGLADELRAREITAATIRAELEQRATELGAAQQQIDSLEHALAQGLASIQNARQEAEIAAKADIDRARTEFEYELVRAKSAFLKDLREAEAARKDAEEAAKVEVARAQEEFKHELDRAKTVLANDFQLAREGRDAAEAAALANEGKLVERFQELATLSNLLREQESRNDEVEEYAAWLTALNEALVREPGWWHLMPRQWRRRQSLRRLRETGLFDGDGYLRSYPDVAEAGFDPLDHYVRHGHNEDRSRNF